MQQVFQALQAFAIIALSAFFTLLTAPLWIVLGPAFLIWNQAPRAPALDAALN